VSSMAAFPVTLAAPLTPEQLFRRLDALGIAHRTVSHRPVFTVAEAAAARGRLPGGTPFALVNDVAHRVAPVLDRAMLDLDPLNYHPLANDRTTAIAPADLLRFIAACGHQPRIVDLADLTR